MSKGVDTTTATGTWWDRTASHARIPSTRCGQEEQPWGHVVTGSYARAGKALGKTR